MIFTKGAHQNAKFQTFDCSGEISPNLYLIGSFCWKYIKFQLKRYTGVIYISWYWRMMQNLKKNKFVVSKMTRIWWILILALKSLKKLHFDWFLSCKVYNILPKQLTCGSENDITLKNDEISEEELTCRFKIDRRNLTNFDLSTWVWKICTLMDCFWPRYIMFELKKYRGVIFHDTRGWCKIWRKTDFWFGEWHEDFGKISQEHTEVSKLALLLGPFIQSRKFMSLKSTGELCVVTMKNDAKFEKKFTSHFKTDMRNLTNCVPSTWKSQQFAL